MLQPAPTTQVIGIHALFGAFLAGAIMPQNEAFRENLTVGLENFSSMFAPSCIFCGGIDDKCTSQLPPDAIQLRNAPARDKAQSLA